MRHAEIKKVAQEFFLPFAEAAIFFQTMFKFFSGVPCAENFFAELLRFLLLKFPFAVVVNQRGF